VADRPAPPRTAPEGFRYEAVAEGEDWRLVAAYVIRRCRAGAGYRHTACGKPAVAETRRRVARTTAPVRFVWWAYCAEHLYGRWIEGDRIMCWRLTEEGER
jgi:hypothetical protein